MKKLLLLTLFILPLLAQSQQTLTFEQPDSTISWTENGKFWNTSGGSSFVRNNGLAYTGNGFLETKSSYNSKLNFEKPINIISLQMYFDDNDSDWGTWAELKGFDSLGTNTFFVTISNDTTYQEYNLNWTNVSSVGFTVNYSYEVVNNSLGNYVSHTTKDAFVRIDEMSYQEQCKTDTSIIFVTDISQYIAPDGHIYTESGIYFSTITTPEACDSTITVNLTILKLEQPNILDFEEPNNTVTWVEDGVNWQFIGGTDRIANSSIQAYSGIGYGTTSSGSGSKLEFSEVLNITSLQVKYTGGMMASPATLYGHDSVGNVKDSLIIQPNWNYQGLILNWEGISSIFFEVPMDEFYDPMMGPMPVPQNLYFDELVYSLGSVQVCGIPQQTQYSNATSTSVQPYWLWENGKKYIVRHKSINQSTWIHSDTLISTYDGIKNYTITGLGHDSTYQWQVQAICNDTLPSQFSNPFTWTTFCNNPSINYSSATNVFDSSATISWTDFGISMSFDVRFRVVGDPTWNSLTVTDTSSYDLTGLLPSTQYEVQVASLCTASVSSGYSSSVYFTTTGIICQTTYSIVDTTVTSFPYIAPDGGYHYQPGSFSVIIPNVVGCDSVISVTVNLPTISQALIVDFEEVSGTTVWAEDSLTWQFIGGTDQVGMDLYNNYSGSGYGRTSSGSGSKLEFSEVLNITSLQVKYTGGMMASPATLYGHDSFGNVKDSLIIQPNWNYQGLILNWEGISSIFFEVPMDEFYDPMMGPMPMPQNLYFDELVYTTGTTVVCNPPQIGSPVDFAKTDTSAILWWSASNNATSYSLEYREFNKPNWEVVLVGDTTQVEIFDLQSSTQYEVRLRSVCIIGDTSIFSGTESFTTTGTVCQTTHSIVDTTVTSFPYIAPDGGYHYQPGSFSVIIPNVVGCDSVISVTVNLPTISQALIVDFEETSGTKVWTEDSLTWQFIGGTDQVGMDLYNNYSGSGYGRTSSGSGSKFVFEQPLQLATIQVKHTGGTSFESATIYGFDSLGIQLYSKTIPTNFDYQLISLGWEDVSSISFDVPYELMPDGMGGSMTFLQNLYFDEITYSFEPSTEACQTPILGFSEFFLLTDSSAVITWASFDSSTQGINLKYKPTSDSVWTILSIPNFLQYELTNLSANTPYEVQVESYCNSGLLSGYSDKGFFTTLDSVTCQNSYATVDTVLYNTSYLAANGDLYSGTGIYDIVIPNFSGCDSLITVNATIHRSTLQRGLTFEQPDSTKNWTENGRVWNIIGESDIIKNNSNAFAGNGFLEGKTGTTSKLEFDGLVDLNSVQMFFDVSNSDWAPYAQLKAFDSLGTMIYIQGLSFTSDYDLYDLNWSNVKSIGLEISEGNDIEYDSLGNIISNEPIDVYVRLDELIYSEPCNAQYDTISAVAISNYIGPNGEIFYNSGIYTVITPATTGCDSIITLDLIISKLEQDGILDFEEDDNVASWSEDNRTWQFTGGNDRIVRNRTNSFSGVGHGESSSGSSSKLSFEEPLSLQSIQIKYTGGTSFENATIFGYDSLNTIIASHSILANPNYQFVMLNWDGISSISFDIPYDVVPDPVNPTITMQFPTSLYFDELAYLLATPTVSCPGELSLCLPSTIPDYSGLVSFNGDTTSFDFTQTPTVNTAWSNETEIVFELKNEADEVISTCASVLNAHPISTVTIDTTSCGSFISPLGAVYNTTSSFTETLFSSNGCDSTITINLTINQSTNPSLNISLVDSFYTSSLGVKYYESATIIDTLTSQYGCDSIVTVNLSVLNTYDKLDFDETISTTSWMEDGYSWSSSPIVHNEPKSGIGHIEFYGNEWVLDTLLASPSLRAEWQMDVKSIWIKAQDASSISEAYIIGFDENDAKLITKRIPNSYLSNTYKKFDLFWEEIKGIHLVYQYMPNFDPMAPPSNPRIYVDEIEYKMLNDTESPVIACLSDTSLCVGAYLPDFTQIVSVTDNKQIASFTQTPSSGTTITEATVIKLTAIDFAGNQDSCSFVVNVKTPSDTTLTMESCYNYFFPPLNQSLNQSGTYVGVIQNGSGCDSTITLNLTINQVPALPQNVTLLNQTVCYGDTLKLSATCTLGTPKWKETYGSVETLGNELNVPIPFNNRVGPYIVSCITSTCESGPQPIDSLFNITFAVPSQSPIITAKYGLICIGEKDTLIASNCEAGQIVWSTGAIGDTLVVEPTASQTYTARCFAGGCYSQVSNEVMVDIGTRTLELPLVSAEFDTTCVGQSVNIYGGGGCLTRFIWEDGSTYSSIVVNPQVTTTYRIACTNSFNTCTGDFVSKTITVIDSLAAPLLTIDKNDICYWNEQVELTASGCDGGKINWSFRRATDGINNRNSFYPNISYDSVIVVSPLSGSYDNPNIFYYANCQKGGCISGESEVELRIMPPNLISQIEIDRTSLCNNSTATVSFEVSPNVALQSNNVFQVFISDENGDFVNEQIIGQLNSTALSATVEVQMPSNIQPSTNYLLRVKATGLPFPIESQKCFVRYPSLTIQSGKDIYINRSNATCENSELLLSAYSSGINLNDYEITWYKDDISINSKDQDTLASTIYKRIFSKPSDAGLYYVTAYRESDGCILTSNTYQNNIDANVFPPIIPDTSIQRGQQLTLTPTGCNGYTLWGFRGDYIGFTRFIEGGGENTFDMGIVNTETTIYVACLDGCFSNIVPVKITVFDPPNAPSPPILSVEHNNSCMYTGITPIVTATGCSGSVRWAYNKNMEDIIEIDNVAPYKFTPPYELGGTFYADCVENGILSSGQSEIIITRGRADEIAYHTLVPKKVNEVNGYEVNSGSDVTVSISENNIKDQYHCLNGNIHWFDSASSGILLSVGDSYTKLNVTSDYEVYSSCVRDGCESPRKKAKVVVASNVNSFELHQSNYAICESGTVILSVSGCANNNIKWFESENSTTELFTGNNFQTPNLTASAGTNMLTEYWAFCADGVATERKKVNVYVTPPPNIPVVTDSVGTCNAPDGAMFAQGCNPQIEESSWYKNGQPYGYYGGTYLADKDLWLNRADNWSYRNQTEYNAVSCRNIISGCESPRVPFTFTYDCTPPPPPSIGVANTTSIITSPKDKNTSLNKGISTFNIEICSEEEIIISTPDCTEGAIFWSDGGAGNVRKLNPKKPIVGLTATCTNTKYVTSEQSNAVNINIKPTPNLLVVKSFQVEPGETVDLTNSSVTVGSVFPVGTSLTYYTDSLTSVELQNPSIVNKEGNYYIKAEAPNGCFDIENTTILINYCNSNIFLTSPTDNYLGEVISKRTNKAINASNRITNGSKVDLMGKEAIILSPGFIATSDQGGVFKAIIEGCPE